jgi:hypothetical protein
MTEITVDQLIKVVEDALVIVATRSDNLGLTLMKADLELSMGATHEGGTTIKFDWFVSVEAGAKIESGSKHVLSLSLVPKGGTMRMDESPKADELADAILALAKAIKGAGKSKFVVTEGKVEVKFVATRQGTLKVVAGGGTKAEDAHSIKLTFQ